MTKIVKCFRHTPGPWGFEGELVFTHDSRIICVVQNPSGPSPRWQADVRLIAASPEMADVLVSCEDMLARRADPGAPTYAPVDERRLLTSVSAVLAKVRVA